MAHRRLRIGFLMDPLPRIIPDLLIFSGIFLLGISVARHQTMIERHTTIQDFPVSLLTIFCLVGFYVLLGAHRLQILGVAVPRLPRHVGG